MEENSGQTIEVHATDFARIMIEILNALADERINAIFKFSEMGEAVGKDTIIFAVDETRIYVRLDDDGFQVGRRNNQRGGRWEVDEDKIGLTADQVIPIAVAEMKQQIAVDVLAWVRAADASGNELSQALRKARDESSEHEL